MTTRLQIYNGALRICEARSIASLVVNEESRRVLDEVWNDGGVHACLEQAQWKFGMRTSQLDFNPSIAPTFGYSKGFTKPTDWCVTSSVCSDESFNSPLTQYTDEAGYWFCDLEILYVRYVSDAAAYGGDLSRWPATFTDYVQAYFARKICKRIPGGKDLHDAIVKEEKRTLFTAKSKDAMAGPATFPARGSWVQARFGRGGANRRDGGFRSGNLTD